MRTTFYRAGRFEGGAMEERAKSSQSSVERPGAQYPVAIHAVWPAVNEARV